MKVTISAPEPDPICGELYLFTYATNSAFGVKGEELFTKDELIAIRDAIDEYLESQQEQKDGKEFDRHLKGLVEK